VVSRSSLPSKHDSTGSETRSRVALDAVVQYDDVRTVEQLVLVLVDSFNLYVKH
jgi:hypothetical protein